MDATFKATRLLKHFLEAGEVTEAQDRELFLELKEPSVRSALAVFEEELDFRLVDAPHACYLSPNMDNELFGFQGRDFRRWFGPDGLKADGFLIAFLAMVLLDMFYGGHNQVPKQRDFLRVAALVEEVDKRFAAILADPQGAGGQEEQVSLNLVRVAEVWSAKLIAEEGRRKTKEGTTLNALNLLVAQKLIVLTDEDREIRPTRKLDDLMLHWFLADNRVQEIQALFRSQEAAGA